MFRLTIDLPPAPAISVHFSREAAHAALMRYLADTGHAHRLAETAWTHTSYVIGDRQTPLGYAAIDEICACEHTHREHDDVGCTVSLLGDAGLSDCDCRCYQAVCDDPTL